MIKNKYTVGTTDNLSRFRCGGKMKKKSGGSLPKRNSRINKMKSGGPININPANKGKFTKWAKSKGMSVQEAAAHVMANTDKYSPTIVKRANFAKNAAKWKKQEGGVVDMASGILKGIPNPITQGIGTGIDVISNIVDMFSKPEDPAEPLKQDNSLYMKKGGFMNYSGPSHEFGGIPVNELGNPDSQNAVAEVEGGETMMHTPNTQPYIYSDYLIDSQSGKTFAKKSKEIYKKYKRDDRTSQKTKELELKMLANRNEQARQFEEVNKEGLPMAQDGLDMSKVFTGIAGIGNAIVNNPVTSQILEQRQRLEDTQPLTPIEFKPVTELAYESDTSLPASDNYQRSEDVVPVKDNKFNLNTLAIGAKVAPLAFGVVDALRGSEQEKLQTPDYSRGDRFYQGLATSNAPQIQMINQGATAAINDINQSSQSSAQRSARVNSVLSQAARNAGLARMQQDQINNQINMQRGTREDQKATTISNERIRQQTAQAQNDANSRFAARKLMSDLSKVGSTLNQVQYMRDEMQNNRENLDKAIKFQLANIGAKYKDFGLTSDAYERLMSGNYTFNDIIVFTKAFATE